MMLSVLIPAALSLLLPLASLRATAEELWLVELERYDGVLLQFQGAELELGSAIPNGPLALDALIPGAPLMLWQQQGVITRLELQQPNQPLPGDWLRGQDRLHAFDGQHLMMETLGTLSLVGKVRWVNGSVADLHPGCELVLTRSREGRLREVLVINPEE